MRIAEFELEIMEKSDEIGYNRTKEKRGDIFMFFKLLILFIIVPLLELALLIKIGTLIGTLNTILVILITGILGAALAKQQGLGVITRIREDLALGRIPSDELFNGVCILIGGFLLLTPGLLTDVLGFCLLIPATRQGIKKYLRYKIEQKWENDNFWQNH